MDRSTTTPHRIEAWAISLPMVSPFSSARSHVDRRRLIVVRLVAGELEGWGEAAPMPGHTSEQVDELWSTLQYMVSSDSIDVPTGGPGMLAAALSQAGDDLHARASGRPLWRALGGKNDVAASAAIGIGKDEQPDFSQIESAAAAGYHAAKLKVTAGTSARSVAEAIDSFPAMRFGIDANGTLTADDLALLRALDQLDLSYIEQPGDPADLRFHAMLRRNCDTPICVDESAYSEAAIRAIVEARAADIVNLKVGRFGTTAALRIGERTAAAGLALRVGGLLESGIGRAHAVALASNPIFSVTGDIAGSDRYFADDLVRPQWRVASGFVELPAGPGIGVRVDEAAVTAHATDTLCIG